MRRVPCATERPLCGECAAMLEAGISESSNDFSRESSVANGRRAAKDGVIALEREIAKKNEGTGECIVQWASRSRPQKFERRKKMHSS